VRFLTPPEQEIVFALAERLTGSSQKGHRRKSVLAQNVARRVHACGYDALAPYLARVEADPKEFQQLVSALTIHHTGWFREAEHFDALFKELDELGILAAKKPLRFLSAACSTGEEAYSLAFFLQQKKDLGLIFDYEVKAFDIDPVSVETAKRGIYTAARVADVPGSYRKYLREGSGRAEGLVAVDAEIRARVRFFVSDLRAVPPPEQAFDVVICRNVLIYFDEPSVNAIVKSLAGMLAAPGLLCLGHSEAVESRAFGFRARGRSIYATGERRGTAAAKPGAKRVLVVDDSTVIRRVLASILEKAGFRPHAVGSAREADEYLRGNEVDAVTLDLRMPEVDGATWLRQARERGFKKPIIIVSDSSPAEVEDVLALLAQGAQDFIEKKELNASPHRIVERLSAVTVEREPPAAAPTAAAPQAARAHAERPELIVVGASTGGTEDLVRLLSMLPAGTPPVLVVQHIPEAFAAPFARRLAAAAGLTLGPAVQGAPLLPQHLYMAQGDYHIGVRRSGGRLTLDVSGNPPEHSVRPAVDVLFRTAAATRARCLGVLLTGMGRDGALGLLELKNGGNLTLVQDEASSVVFGMPREAIQLNAHTLVGDLTALRLEIDRCIVAAPLRKEA
jgi:two-component system chemotaxis response regulator CheB